MDVTNSDIKISFKQLPPATHEALLLLSKHPWIKENGWYLAGGTALSLQGEHRVSVDLDFFTKQNEFDAEFIINTLSSHGWTTTLREKGTLYGELKGAKISFISYPYFLPKQQFILYEHINILDSRDIAVMKIIAISQRGKKRDFVDLYWYAKNREPLLDVLQRVQIQYPNLQHNYHHIIKSLTYFEEAEGDPNLQLSFNAPWEDVKKYFLDIVPKAAEKFL